MKTVLKSISMFACGFLSASGLAMFLISVVFFFIGCSNKQEGTLEVSSVTMGIGLASFIVCATLFAVIKSCWIYIEKNGETV